MVFKMSKKIIVIKIILFININILFSSGIFSDLDKLSIYGSTSYYSYKESFISESTELINLRPNLGDISFGVVYKGHYDLSFSYLNSSESINLYNLPYVDKYISTKFNYHIKRFENFKLKIGLKVIGSKNNKYSRNTFLLGVNKDIDYFNNPVVLYLDVSSSHQEFTNCENKVFNSFMIGGDVKLLVDKIDNNELKDIIWLGFTLNTDDLDKYYFGLNTGLFIPLK